MRSAEFPELPGYMTVAAVAKKFGLQKESIFWRIYEMGTFKHVFRVGSVEETQRPVLLLLTEEVEKVFAAEQVVHVSEAQLLTEWNYRVKKWARTVGWTETPIRLHGRPALAMTEAYLRSNPDDPDPRVKPGPVADG